MDSFDLAEILEMLHYAPKWCGILCDYKRLWHRRGSVNRQMYLHLLLQLFINLAFQILMNWLPLGTCCIAYLVRIYKLIEFCSSLANTANGYKRKSWETISRSIGGWLLMIYSVRELRILASLTLTTIN